MRRTLDRMKQKYYRCIGYNAKTINNLPFKCDPDHVRFWRRMSNGRWEPDTLHILSEYLTPESVFYDIGAWIGPTVLYASTCCRKIYCFEPDYVAYQYLLWNLRLNRRFTVIPFNLALGARNEIRTMSSFGKETGDSQSSLLHPNGDAGLTVLSLRLHTWADIVKPQKADFMKIDIEGAEFELLPDIADYLDQHKPVLYLSTHAHLLENHQKKEKMKTLAAIAELYAKKMDENRKPIPVDEWTSQKSLQQSRSFLLHD